MQCLASQASTGLVRHHSHLLGVNAMQAATQPPADKAGLGAGAHLDTVALVNCQGRDNVGALDLDALGVDDLPGGDHICKNEAGALALIQGDGIHLALHLHAAA